MYHQDNDGARGHQKRAHSWLIELLAFVALFTFGMVLSRSEDASLAIANQLARLSVFFIAHSQPMAVGIFSGMLVFAIITRIMILIVMQYKITKNIGIRFVTNFNKIFFLNLTHIVITCAIGWFVLNSDAYQKSIFLQLAGSWISVFSTALLIQLFIAAIGDAAKQIIFIFLHGAWRK